MKKSLHVISLAALGIILLSGIIPVNAASRTVAINMADSTNKTSSEMFASKRYPVSYMIVTGDTSKGSIKYEITGVDKARTYYTISLSGVCDVGQTLATSDLGGTLSPISIADDSYVTLKLSKGTPTTGYVYYIGSGLISTPTEGARSADITSRSEEMDWSGYYTELNMLADEMRENVNEWDEQNTEYTKADKK